MNKKTDIKFNKKTEAEITLEISAKDLDAQFEATVSDYAKSVTVPGFRAGKAPAKMVAEKVGEEKILLESAEELVREAYPEIIEENKLSAIGRPEVQIMKLAKGNPLEVKITTAVLPDIKLPDYKKIAEEAKKEIEDDIAVLDKDVDEVLKELQKSRAPKGKEGEEKEAKEVLPELNDDFAKSIGKFESLEELRNKIKENLGEEKKQKNKEKKRVGIVENISQKTEVEIPEVLIENELNKMQLELKGQIEQMGLSFADYLTHLKKTEEDLKKDWRSDAEKRVKFGLIMHKIAEDSKITVSDEEIEKETKAIMEYYKNAPEKLDEDRVRAHTENMLVNEKVFQLLEQA